MSTRKEVTNPGPLWGPVDNWSPQIEFGLLGRFDKEPQDLILSSCQLGL